MNPVQIEHTPAKPIRCRFNKSLDQFKTDRYKETIQIEPRGFDMHARADTARLEGIAGMLRASMSWSAIQAATGCSRATIAKVRARAA
jgi:hypothetical protein